jgi:hypothetical protein
VQVLQLLLPLAQLLQQQFLQQQLLQQQQQHEISLLGSRHTSLLSQSSPEVLLLL